MFVVTYGTEGFVAEDDDEEVDEVTEEHEGVMILS